MYDERTNLSNQVMSDLRDFLGRQVFETVIPRNIKLAEAPSYGKPIILYDIASKGSEAYLSLAKEVILKTEGKKEAAALAKPVMKAVLPDAPPRIPSFDDYEIQQ
jgi:chromosome partitioning protein